MIYKCSIRLCRAVLCRNTALLGRQNIETKSIKESRGEDSRITDGKGGQW